jgi:Zn-dependent protease with chaperone function
MAAQEKFDDLIDHTRQYLETRVSLGKLQLVEKGSELSSNLAATMTFVVISVLVVIFGSIALALYLSELMGKSYYGFLTVGVGYAFLGVIGYLMSDKWIKRPVANRFIRTVFKNSGHE